METDKKPSQAHQPLFPWLTGEIALYGLILCLALALRLGGPGIRVMDVPEARQAVQAWQLANGGAPEGRYSPLLLLGQAALFAVFGASDALVRLWPALVGSAIVVLPYFVRAHLGRVGALASALALALSPTLVFSSRYGDGTILLVACVLGVIVLWLAYQEEGWSAYLYAIGLMGAFALLADPRVVGVLIVLAASWAVERLLFRRDLIGTDREHPVPWRKLGVTLGVALVLGATAVSFNPEGLGAWADFISAWGAHLMPVVNGQPWHYPLQALIMYEPLVLVFGIIGAVDLLVHRKRLSVFVWVAVGMLSIALLSGGRGAGDVALVAMPLALLAGRALDSLLANWQKGARLQREGVFVLVALVLLVYVAFEASFYARALYYNLAEAARFLWFWLLAVALIVVLLGVFMAWFGLDMTWRAGGTVAAIVLLLNAFSLTTSLNFYRASDPRELHILSASAEGTRDALHVMADLSYHERGYPTALPITVDAHLGPVWLWYLRDWEDVTVVEELSPNVTTPMVVTSDEQLGGGWNPSDRYSGQDFVTRTWWQPSQLFTNDRLSWWMYRKSQSKPVPTQKAILWMKAEEQVASDEQE